MAKDEATNELKALVPKLRTIQAITLGVFTLGVSMSVGDVATAYEIPISALSITTTLFGGVGSVLIEIMIRRIAKDVQ